MVRVPGLNWTTGANWSGGTAPAAADDVVFNTAGTLTFTTGPGANFSFNSLTISQGTVTIIGTGASRTFTLGGNAGTDFTVASGASLTLSTNLSVTMAANATGDISGTLTVNNGRTFNTNGTTVITTVIGSIVNSGTVTCTTASKLLMQSGSTYTHSQDGGTIPTATWNANSTCSVTGMTGTNPTGLTGVTFGHFIWNCAGQTANLGSRGAGLTIAGNLTIQNSNGFQFRFGQPGNNTIGGNLILNGGNARIGSNTARTVVVSGNLNMTAGTLTMTDGNQNGTLNVAGNFSHTGGTITETGSAAGPIVFNGGTQTFTSGGTVSNTIDWTVNNGATVNMAATGTVVSGNSFTLSNGGTLGITSTAGIVTAPTASGNIQTTTRTFNTGANYSYIGTGGAQVTGNGMPATVNNLTINNTAGVTLSAATAINGALTLMNGILTTTAALLPTVSGTGTAGAGSSTAYVNGPIAKTGAGAIVFPTGKSGTYGPIGITAPGAGNTLRAEYQKATPPNNTSLASGLYWVSACEYWDLNVVAGAPTVDVTLFWNGTGSPCNGATTPYVNNPASTTVAHNNGSSWDTYGGTGSGTPASGSVTRTGVNVFSPFTIGTTSPFNPLPVKFSGITAFEKQTGVQIDWNVATEENTSRYQVERSADGITFTPIGSVDARNQPKYGYYDATPLSGLSYYRLRSIDVDGKASYSSIVRVNLNKNDKEIRLYPNPVTGGNLSFQSSDLSKGTYSIRIFNAGGQQVYAQKFSHTGGAINQTIQLPGGMKSGMYNIQLENNGDKVMSKTFMVQ